MKNNIKETSKTAFFSALRRDLANRIFNDETFGLDDHAKIFLPPYMRFFLSFKRMQKNTWGKLDAAFPGINTYIIARTAYFDMHFQSALERQIPQIVILGAGYDSRAFRFSDLIRNTKIFELDNSPTQNRKKDCLEKAKLNVPKQLVFIPIDFNQEALADVLIKAGYQTDQETLFLWEGVSYYLDPESAEKTLDFFSHSSHHDSMIVFDYTISISEEDLKNSFGSKAFLESMAEHHADEAFMFSIPDDKLQSFLGKRGLDCSEHLDNDEIEQRFLLTKDGNLIGKVAGHFRFVTAGHQTN